MDEDAQGNLDFELSDQIVIVKEMKEKRYDVKKLDNEMEQSYTDWKLISPHRTRASLIAHGKSILEPAKQYYMSLFSENEGYSY